MKNRLRKLREDAGLSQGQLGDALNVSRQTVNAIEVGKYLPRLDLAIQIAHYFETTVEEVFTDDHETAVDAR